MAALEAALDAVARQQELASRASESLAHFPKPDRKLQATVPGTEQLRVHVNHEFCAEPLRLVHQWLTLNIIHTQM
jgi:hypothetical protein